MEFHITRDPDMPEVGVIEAALQDLDPAAMVDVDAGGEVIRLATWIEAGQLVEVLNRAGWEVRPGRVVQQPSVCCGGCGG
ncbi:hypothetical protein WCE55_10205 [Luteimonas sp. MJ293]|uniref:hypothetical protein n=1 Tax=Luteimonas sp. MJ146 TaxID=3129240 RepID=UPI0031BAA073